MKHIQTDGKQFHLCGKDFSYVCGVDRFGYLTHYYYGRRLPLEEDLSCLFLPRTGNDYTTQVDGTNVRYSTINPEYPMAFYGEFREFALAVSDADGVPVTDLRYEGYELLDEKPRIRSGIPVARGGETLVITLIDKHLSLRVRLLYTVYGEENILTRRTVIENASARPIMLDRALTLSVDFYGHEFDALTLHGGHWEERMVDRTPLNFGRFSVGNCRGTSSHHNSPFMALLEKNANEEYGTVFGCSLLYSGSHLQCAEVDQYGNTRLLSGIQPDTFRWKLEGGECFETPEAALCYSHEGLGGMSRSYHDFYRKYVINPNFAYKSRPVVLNSWEGMHFKFNTEKLLSAIDALDGSGIDTFVLDDGWFGARNGATAGLGDWYVNTEKLPGGLKVISDHCHKKGMRFGLWIEPEMVNPDSDLYRAHPDWIISAPGREPILARNQCMLDLTRREVLDYIKQCMYDVIRESGASYIKWDCNRNMTENFSRGLPVDRQGEVQHRYVLALYELAEYLTSSFPDILFEGCSGGGGRFDGAMLAFFPQYWTSDNTDVQDRAAIQYGTGLVFPLSSHSCHVSASPNIRNGRSSSVNARVSIARQGVLGYEFDPLKESPEELAEIHASIQAHRETEELILSGDLYRRENVLEGNGMCQTVVSKDKKRAMVIWYQTLVKFNKEYRMRAAGLDPDTMYRIQETGAVYSGALLCQAGLPQGKLPHDFETVLWTLEAVEE